jgi:hypothetical protein
MPLSLVCGKIVITNLYRKASKPGVSIAAHEYLLNNAQYLNFNKSTQYINHSGSPLQFIQSKHII